MMLDKKGRGVSNQRQTWIKMANPFIHNSDSETPKLDIYTDKQMLISFSTQKA